VQPIPVIADPERYALQEFKDSEFVEIISDSHFVVEMQYPLLNMENAENKCFVRKEVYEHLLEAASKLPRGFRFKILDAWRPFALQHELYEKYAKDIIKEFELEGCTENQTKAVIRKFVSDPIPDRDVPPVHTTGGAVDLTIVNRNEIELEMGSAFDEFTDRTSTAYYEIEKNEVIRDNRRLLFHVMTEAGFTNLPSDWWHFDYGDRFWGFYNNCIDIYRGAFTKEELNGK
jgi:D-alanyl-D-alanine dipeptidase